MKAFQPYLFFNGNCREAMTFYGKALGVEPHIMTYDQMPPQPSQHAGADKVEGCTDSDMAASKNRVMHAAIRSGDALLMASDQPVGQPDQPVGGFSVNIDCETQQEQDKFFAALGEGGHIIMPLGDTFWGARFGMVKDKFGVHWMFNLEKK